MVYIKSKEEIEVLREGGKILAEILNKISVRVRPGISAKELDDLALDLIFKAGGRAAFKNYKMPDGQRFPNAPCVSINDEVVHGVAAAGKILKSGDIVGLDIGLEYPFKGKSKNISKNRYSPGGGFFTDMAATLAVGSVDREAKRLMDTTKECLARAIEIARPGNTLSDIGAAVQTWAEKNGFSVVRELVGHGVGYLVHEDPQVPNFQIRDRSIENIVLKPGMVIAIEPMINQGGWRVKQGEDGFSFVTADGSLSAHFEHSIAITEGGNIVLTDLEN